MPIGSVEITLGKDVTITGVSNARSCTVTNSASDVDVTKFGDTSRKFRKALIEQTVELECVDAPGVSIGSTFTIAGTQTGNATYVCTNIAKSQPLDGIETFTVSGSRTVQP
jgi:Tfp pilus assembly protein PilW